MSDMPGMDAPDGNGPEDEVPRKRRGPWMWVSVGSGSSQSACSSGR